jgi:hypothetical protein
MEAVRKAIALNPQENQKNCIQPAQFSYADSANVTDVDDFVDVVALSLLIRI